VILAKYNEDVSWLKQARKKSGNAFDTFVYQSRSPKEPYYVPNRGFEATKYFKFILDNYENLPPRMLFLHAHNKASHNPCGASTMLDRWNWKSKMPVVFIPASFHTFPYKGFSHWNTIKWIDLVQWGQELAHMQPRDYNSTHPITLPLNAQFMVDRESVLRHPKTVYQGLYSFGIQKCNPPAWMQERHPARPFMSNG
jgi:hypothetical protein